MVKILNGYLYAQKVMDLCLRVQFLLANPIVLFLLKTEARLFTSYHLLPPSKKLGICLQLSSFLDL